MFGTGILLLVSSYLNKTNRELNVKGFYLLRYLIAVSTLPLSLLNLNNHL